MRICVEYSPFSPHLSIYFLIISSASFPPGPKYLLEYIVYTLPFYPLISFWSISIIPPVPYFFSVKTVNIYPFVCVEWKEGGGGFLLLAVTGVIVKLYCFSDSSLKHGYWIFIMNVSVLLALKVKQLKMKAMALENVKGEKKRGN